MNLDAELPEVLKKAIDEYVPALGDWMEVKRAYQMASLILQTKPALVVEIGTFKGQSLLAQAFALRHNGHGYIVGIDPWVLDYAIEGMNDPENDSWWKTIDMDKIHTECWKVIRDHNLDRWAGLLRAPSHYCAQIFEDIDILYIDGNHSEEASCRDVELFIHRVRDGGYVWFDDAGWPTTQKALGIMENVYSCDKVFDGGHYRLYQKMLHWHA